MVQCLFRASDSKYVPAELAGFVGELRRFAVAAFRLRDFKIPLLNQLAGLKLYEVAWKHKELAEGQIAKARDLIRLATNLAGQILNSLYALRV